MWTEAHRARHEAGLKEEMVSACAVEASRARCDGAVAGAGGPAAQREGDARVARRRCDRLAPARGRALARAATRRPAWAEHGEDPPLGRSEQRSTSPQTD